jgi:hypothetical protein
MRWERPRPRYPVTDEGGMTGGRLSRFEGGEITWTPGRRRQIGVQPTTD